ncbi:solute carrier family 22 member 13-like isoform X2 [Eublepharis macularius]|uniref:Solute carrier family 22 member 13-like isoform X2 n=1 Tax=Eublepharis macularius TaxID=481883 RepID=A0AA97K2B4_EUBMA|nr:solute carrier family 22 member 13-like isoform X2 [Eublepharis macularius]
MEFGDILKVIGEFGRFQKWLVLLLCIPNFLTPFHLFGQVFIVMDVPHYCNTSRIRELNWNLTKEQALNLTIPRKPDGSLEECRMFTPVQGSLPSIRFNSTEKCQDGWVYPEELQPTLLTEFNLVCERKNLNDFSQSIFMAGVLAGALVFGPLSDRIGSRNMILLTLLLMGSFGLGAGFAPSLNVYIALRFIVGSAFAGMSISMAVLNSEWVGAAYRPFAIIMTYCCNSMGQMALAGLAYSIRDWRLYQIVGSAPALCLFFYIWVLPSSARWLVTRGKVVEAKKEIQRAARINKQSIPEELLNQLAPQKKGTSGSILHLLKKPHLRKITLIMAWVWQTSLGLCSMCSRIGGILAPLAGLLDEIHPAISMVLFGSTSLVGGILCFFLPETRNRDLQDDTTKASSSQLSNKAVNGGFGNGPVEEKDERWITEITKSTSL